MDKNEFEQPIPVYAAKEELELKQIFPRGLRAKLPLYHDVMTNNGITPIANEEVVDKLVVCGYKIVKLDSGLGLMYVGDGAK